MKAGFWLIGRWKDIPLVLHWSALLPLAWLALKYKDFGAAVSTFLAFLALMTVHELGHAAAARSRGLDVIGIRLHFLHGMCLYETPKREKDDVFIAWGGVLAQLCLLAVALLVQAIASAFFPGSARVLQPVLFVFIHANVVICAFNLIPVAPLDGHRAWRVVPLLWQSLKLHLVARMRSFGRRKEIDKASGAATDELLDRLRKK